MPMIEVETKPCPICGKQKTLLVDKENYENWLRREIHIQDAFPEMSADDRERFLSGYCPKCWDKLFENM